LTLEEFDNKEKYFDGDAVFLNLRDKMIEDLRLVQNTTKVRIEEFISKSTAFFNRNNRLGMEAN